MDIKIRRMRNDMANTLFHMQRCVELMSEKGKIDDGSVGCLADNAEIYAAQRHNALREDCKVSDLNNKFYEIIKSYNQLKEE